MRHSTPDLPRPAPRPLHEAFPLLGERLPHVALARLRDGRPAEAQQFCDDHAMFKLPPYGIDRFVLYSSFLSHTGAIYTPEEEYPLGG